MKQRNAMVLREAPYKVYVLDAERRGIELIGELPHGITDVILHRANFNLIGALDIIRELEERVRELDERVKILESNARR